MKHDEERGDLADFAVLIVAYRRADNVEKIAKSSIDYGIQEIFIHVDGVGSTDPQIVEDQKKMSNFLKSLKANTSTRVQVLQSTHNKGIAVSIISACDWVFSTSSRSFLIVLEDDCLPTEEFFEFCREYSNFLSHPQNLLLCGTNPSPKTLSTGIPILSHYSLTWGWMTNREKWLKIKRFYRVKPIWTVLIDLVSFRKIDCFWNAGYRRAIQGITDVWDTVLVRSLRNQKFFAILPPWTLVSNVGNDNFATHTKPGSTWTLPVSNPKKVGLFNPLKDTSVDSWFEDHLFQIRSRHVITTKFTLFKDIFTRSQRRFQNSLPNRLTQENGKKSLNNQ